MAGIPEKEPFQRILIIPLPELSEFTPHKGELFSGKGHLKEEKQPDSGKFLLIAAEHFVDQGLFAMHHLVVGYRKHIVLAEGVHHGKGQCGVQIFPAHRIAGHITKHIVCPAHVPFHCKTKSVVFCLSGHLRPCRRLLCNHHQSRITPYHQAV